VALYAKTTVSELKTAKSITSVIDLQDDSKIYGLELFAEPEIVPYIPGFIKDEAPVADAVISGSIRGSAYHRIMELINFEKLHSLLMNDNDIEVQITDQINAAFYNGRLSAAEKEAASLDKILGFFYLKDKSTIKKLSPLATRMITADQNNRLHKEQPFVIGINANQLNIDLPATETILIQGIIDVFFAEEDGLVILDYKSDAVTAKEELITRYQKQLDYYQEALEQLTGKPVKEKIIYSFALNEAIILK
jgi:ATP-dependent helicase/nuclease subunit A